MLILTATQLINERMIDLLGSDTVTFSEPANIPKIQLVAAPFTPSEDLAFGDLVFSTDNDQAEIFLSPGVRGRDPRTGENVLTWTNGGPLGVFTWATGVTLPQTIYGWAIFLDTSNVLLCTAAFPVPIVINDHADFIEISFVILRFSSLL